MSGWTNKGKYRCLGKWLRDEDGYFTNGFYLCLITSDTAPTADTDTLNDLTYCVTGNGYDQNGEPLSKNSTDFDALTEVDTTTLDYAQCQITDVTWTASGGDMPTTAATYAVLVDRNGTLTDREVFIYWYLGGNRQVSTGQTLTLQDCEIRISEGT